jgi:hypothetical protein
MVAEGEAFDRIAQRLVEFSAVHGTDVTIVEGGLEVALRAPATA